MNLREKLRALGASAALIGGGALTAHHTNLDTHIENSREALIDYFSYDDVANEYLQNLPLQKAYIQPGDTLHDSWLCTDRTQSTLSEYARQAQQDNESLQNRKPGDIVAGSTISVRVDPDYRDRCR